EAQGRGTHRGEEERTAEDAGNAPRRRGTHRRGRRGEERERNPFRTRLRPVSVSVSASVPVSDADADADADSDSDSVSDSDSDSVSVSDSVSDSVSRFGPMPAGRRRTTVGQLRPRTPLPSRPLPQA